MTVLEWLARLLNVSFDTSAGPMDWHEKRRAISTNV